MIKWNNTFSQTQRRQMAVLILALLIGLAVYYFLSQAFQTRQDVSATLSVTKAEIEDALQLGVIQDQKPSEELLREHSDIDVATIRPRSEDIVPHEEKSEDTTIEEIDTEAVTVKQSKIIPPTPAGYYYLAATPPANDKYDFGEWTAKPVSVTEITEKRQKIAQGERLYKRVIVKRPDPFGRPTTIDDISSGVAN